MTTYVVPTSKAGKWLQGKKFTVATDEAEAVAMACGEYLATGETSRVVMGENGFLNALDSLVSLAQLHEIPVELVLFPRDDEPQHAMVTKNLRQMLDLFNIKAEVK